MALVPTPISGPSVLQWGPARPQVSTALFSILPLALVTQKLLSTLDTLTISLGLEEQGLSVHLSFLCGRHRTPDRHGPRRGGP